MLITHGTSPKRASSKAKNKKWSIRVKAEVPDSIVFGNVIVLSRIATLSSSVEIVTITFSAGLEPTSFPITNLIFTCSPGLKIPSPSVSFK